MRSSFPREKRLFVGRQGLSWRCLCHAFDIIMVACGRPVGKLLPKGMGETGQRGGFASKNRERGGKNVMSGGGRKQAFSLVVSKNERPVFQASFMNNTWIEGLGPGKGPLERSLLLGLSSF